jgi:diguanylate cyclase (GGDEF)-like protein
MFDVQTLLISSVTARTGFLFIFAVYSFRAYAAVAYRFWTLSIVMSAMGLWLTYQTETYPLFSANRGALVYFIISLSIVSVWAGALSFFRQPVGRLNFFVTWLAPPVACWLTLTLSFPQSLSIALTLVMIIRALIIASLAFLSKTHARRLPSQILVGMALAVYAVVLTTVVAAMLVRFGLGYGPPGPEDANIFVSVFVDQLFSVLVYVGLIAMALEQAQRHMKDIATTDPLTGLANRRGLEERTRAVIGSGRRNSRPMAVLLADIDHFKSINDRYGHDGGDLVLKQFAVHLQMSLQRQQDVVARWGGEEFVAVIHDTPLEDAVAFANQLCRLIEAARFTVGSEVILVTCSIGVALITEEKASLEGALSVADAGLYEAKRSGRNKVCVGTACEVEALAG